MTWSGKRRINSSSVRRESCGSGRCVILVLKRHLTIFKVQKTLVAERHPMGVPAEILNDLSGSAEGRLGINDPFALASRLEVSLERIGVAEGFQRSMKFQFALLIGEI